MSAVPMSTAGNVFVIAVLVIAAACGLLVMLLNHQMYGTLSKDPKTRQAGRTRKAQDERDQKAARRQAQIDAQAKIVCQFCHEAGHVTARLTQQKQGVSGGKATSAILTGGVSLFAVGLSKKGWVTHLTCSNCNMQWDVA